MTVFIGNALKEAKTFLKAYSPNIRYRTKIDDRGHGIIHFTLIVSNLEDYDLAYKVGQELIELLETKYTDIWYTPQFFFVVRYSVPKSPEFATVNGGIYGD